jgi:hypothetical protein
MWDRVKSLGSKRITGFLTRKYTMKGNGTEGRTF